MLSLHSLLLWTTSSIAAMAFSPSVLTDLASIGGGMHHHVAHVLHPAAQHNLLLTKSSVAHDLLQSYTQSLKTHPLITKMLTGGTLATCGDAIAQKSASSNNDNDAIVGDFVYDSRRAGSFAAFDMAYRALQHVSFPLIVQQCQGQFATAFLHGLPFVASAAQVTENVHFLAAMEQTLASQLGIVPFIYYPVFFALTGVMQGLTSEQAATRAMENFVPLMKRNLVFWIPVQFVQFAFVPQDLQIPFLSVCGLCWTFILSAFAGSTKGYQSGQQADSPTTLVEIEHDDFDEGIAVLLEDRQRIVVANDTKAEVRELVRR